MNVQMQMIRPLFARAIGQQKDSAVVVALFENYATLTELMNTSEHELTRIKGIGPAMAQRILATIQLTQKINAPVYGQRYTIRSPKDVADLLIPQMKWLTQEHFVILTLNTKNIMIGSPQTISIGSLNAAIVKPLDVFRIAIQRSAASIVCVHNHPSTDPTPSQEDRNVTALLVEAGRLMSIEVLDHVIIGGDSFYSMKENGLM
ncbi:DNA repair protein RadC [Saccharibacillus sp. CPCC 101409]|uniref:RadC family protein n=1 Tax=Saccharibacillus sp. CPCC 101409 TaxID=3058041 RepID=UPI002671C078|nr:DNA repair protein RadC [Saccharibacillus sp. CPCC 101409]MDO3411488.1 DNA repair protein RadC [Saccharibacillus sp. CPCC 101409]